MAEIIFTADDFGVVDSINDAVIDLVNHQLINSVEVLTNYGKNGSKSIENTKKLLDQTQDSNSKIELGIHLTITSGKPLTNSSGLSEIIENGSFKNFGHISSKANTKSIYNELAAQIEVLISDAEIKPFVTHITNHHDSLWFFPEYAKQLVQISNDFDLPIRNPKSFPKKRNYTYNMVIVPLLGIGKMSAEDASMIREGYLLRAKNKFPDGELKFLSTHFMDSRFYGPLPPAEIKMSQKKRHLTKKGELMEQMLSNISPEDIAEFMFHVRKGSDNENHRTFDEEMKTCGYEGINPNYFDSRTIEYQGLKNNYDRIKLFMTANNIKYGSWKNATTIQLRGA